MARPELSLLDRLSHSIWLRAAISRYLEEIRIGATTPKHPVPSTGRLWAWFEREMIGSIEPSDMLNPRAGQLIAGVANDGNDPRRLKRLIPCEQASDHGRYEEYKIVYRKPSGRPSPDQKSDRIETAYYEVPLDLVEVIEERLPGSSSWESAFLWTLVKPDLLPLETIRRRIAQLLGELKYCRPWPEERQLHASASDDDAMAPELREETYRASLVPLTKDASAQSISLLGALCAESHLSEDEALLKIHCDAFEEAAMNFFTAPLLEEAKRAFAELVARPILTGYWEEPDLPVASDIARPLVSLADWELQIGHKLIVL